MAIIWLRNSLTSTKKMTFTGILHLPNAAHIPLLFHLDIFYKSITIRDKYVGLDSNTTDAMPIVEFKYLF